MNRIYKVIWSKAKNCYVVASELAKRHTKGSGTRSLSRAAVTLGVVAGLTVGMTGSAWAAVNSETVSSSGNNNITVYGGSVTSTGNNSITVSLVALKMLQISITLLLMPLGLHGIPSTA